MFKTAKDIAVAGVTIALLIGGQLVLSGIKGVEIVTVLLLSFCCVYGVIRGVIVAIGFSLLRCLIFGFFPQVVILYLVYYSLFAIVMGLLGKCTKNAKLWLQIIIFTVVAVVMTAIFTLIDDIITPLFFGYTKDATVAYFVASLPVMLTHIINASITVALLYAPLSQAMKIAHK